MGLSEKISEFKFCRQPMAGRTLVLAAHPDDEVLGCGGAVIHHCRQGDPVFILIFTDGGFALDPTQNTPGYALLRKKESTEAAMVMGCGVPRFLDFKDQGLRDKTDLIKTIVTLYHEFRPENIYLPAMTEIHPDHQALSVAGIEAAKQYGDEVSLFCYEISAPVIPSFYLDITPVIDQKNSAIDCFVSQTKVRNLKSQINGLNQYRAYYLPPDVSAAEAFLAIDRKTLLRENLCCSISDDLPAELCREGPDDDEFPLVSVIVRTVNNPLLPEALESVARQKYPNLEVILVDAIGNTSIPAVTAPEHVGIRLINRGKPLTRSEAANAGLDEIKGTYFCFLDEDDLIEPSHILELWRCLRYRDELAAYAGIRMVDEHGTIRKIFNEPFDFAQLFCGNYIPINAVLYRKEVLSRGCRFDENLQIYEDWDFLLSVSCFGDLYHLKKISGTYRNFHSSGVHGNTHVASEEKSRVLSKWNTPGCKRAGNNPFYPLFFENRKNIIHKWPHYFEIYHRYFQKFINKDCIIVEIGVSMGGSLKMWRSYFGEKARIIGIDINPECKKFEEPGIEVFIGSQSDREFLKQFILQIPPIDILIDDGGHRMEEQITTFEALFPHISDHGIYICEDTHTSYLDSYGGGIGKSGTFIEFAKTLVDHLHAWHIPDGLFPATSYTRNINSISFHDSIVVIEKQARVQPWSEMSGEGIPAGKEPITAQAVMMFRKKLQLLGAGLPEHIDVGGLMSHPLHLQAYLGDQYEGLSWPETGVTMIGWKRLTNLEYCVNKVLDDNIPGDFIETGVWRGGACIWMRYLLSLRNVSDRIVWVADSFQGLPAPDKDHCPQDMESDLHTYPILAVSEEEVKQNFLRHNVPLQGVKFLRGWFKETMQVAPVRQLAILRLDGDLYESTMEVLTYLYPKLVLGGYCIIDDYGAIPACRQAVEDYRLSNGILEEMIRIDFTGVFWRKEKE